VRCLGPGRSIPIWMLNATGDIDVYSDLGAASESRVRGPGPNTADIFPPMEAAHRGIVAVSAVSLLY